MLIAGIILRVFGIGFFCWLLFTLAMYALPFFAGLTAGLAAFHRGAGVIGALIVGILAGDATLAIGQIVFAAVRTRSSAPRSGSAMPCPPLLPASMRLSDSRMSASRPKPGTRSRRGRRCSCWRHGLGAHVLVT